MRSEATPCRLSFLSIPLIAEDEDLSTPKRVKAQGLTTSATTVEDAQQRAEEKIGYVKRRVERDDFQALVKLIDDRPDFVADQWVLDTLLKWRATDEPYRNRGRKMASFIRHPLLIAALVEELLRRGWVNSKAAAFRWLENRGWLSATAARDSYYQALSDDRFMAVLIQNPVGARLQSEQEISKSVSEAELLESGKTITRTLAEFPEGPLTLTLEGL